MSSRKWDARIERARQLESVHPYASEVLSFYIHIARTQKAIYATLEARRAASKAPSQACEWRNELDPLLAFPHFTRLLQQIEEHGPAPISSTARELRQMDAVAAQNIVREFWHACLQSQDGFEPKHALILSLFVQPVAEFLADHGSAVTSDATPSVCPRCQHRPLVGALRPEGDGAKRSLICSFCATEWSYRRMLCPECGEEDVHKLAVYSAAGIENVRVEACDACRNYVKTVDLTKDGRAVPLIDELASVPLNLWAAEHGYTRAARNLLGL